MSDTKTTYPQILAVPGQGVKGTRPSQEQVEWDEPNDKLLFTDANGNVRSESMMPTFIQAVHITALHEDWLAQRRQERGSDFDILHDPEDFENYIDAQNSRDALDALVRVVDPTVQINTIVPRLDSLNPLGSRYYHPNCRECLYSSQQRPVSADPQL